MQAEIEAFIAGTCGWKGNETPAAYPPIEAVMAAQKDLVEVLHTLKQVVCVKG